MSEELGRQLALLPDYLGAHMLLTLVALSVGIALSLPLAILVSRYKVLRGPALALAGVIQTVPSLALLALMVPLLGQIGVVPAIIALILYSMLPILRNTVTGLEEADPAAVQAAVGIGMTDVQVLLKVKFPLALPVIVAGIRTAAVWTVGIATLSTPVGATSLGNYIFSGLQTQNYTAVLVGVTAAAGLALMLDGLIHALEYAARKRSRTTAAVAGSVLIVLFAFGLIPSIVPGDIPTGSIVMIGTKTFTEQYILAEAIEEILNEAGMNGRRLESLGSTVVFNALATNRIDCYVDYSGTIWANHMKRDDNPGRAAVLAEVTKWLKDEHGIVCLGSLGFENAYALAMRKNAAEEKGIRTIDDLVAFSLRMKIGGDYEFFQRPEWRALVDAYGLSFGEEISFDSSLMYSAVAEGQVDVISAFSSDGRIAAFDLVVLEDTKQVLPPYDAILLLSPRAAGNAELVERLKTLVGGISAEMMRRANMLVDVEKRSVEDAAAFLLESISKTESIQ